MDYTNIGLFGLMKAKMNYLSARQGVLAQNVANADTPGYKAMDIAEPNFKKMVTGHQMKMTATDPKHLTGSKGSVGGLKLIKRPGTDELNPNGNNVVLEEEVAKAGQSQMDYQKALSVYGKTISLFKMALGNTSGG